MFALGVYLCNIILSHEKHSSGLGKIQRVQAKHLQNRKTKHNMKDGE